MGKAYWLGVIFVLVGGLSASWYLANQSQNSLLLLPQQIENLEIVKPFVFDRTDSLDWFFLAPEPQNQVHWNFTLKVSQALQAQGWKIIVDPYFAEQMQYSGDLQLGLLQNRDSFFNQIQAHFPNEKRVVILPNIAITQVVSDSILLKSDIKKFRTLSFFSYPKSREDEAQFFLPCSESRDLKTGPSELGCFIRQQSRPHYKVLSTLPTPAGFLLKYNSTEFSLFLL